MAEATAFRLASFSLSGAMMASFRIVKFGGVCAILFVVSFVVAAIVYFAVVGQVDPGDVDQVLIVVDDNRTAFLTSISIFLLGSALLIPAALGFFQALREAGPVVWIAVVAMSTGALLFVSGSMLTLGVGYVLAPGYVGASDAARPALTVVASHLDSIDDAADIGVLLVLWILKQAELPLPLRFCGDGGPQALQD